MCADRAAIVVVINSSRGHPNPHRGGEHTRKERTMLNAALGMLAMVPVVFGVGGYVLVNRQP